MQWFCFNGPAFNRLGFNGSMPFPLSLVHSGDDAALLGHMASKSHSRHPNILTYLQNALDQ
eukprot:1543320-Amphidinium_carterae.1